MPQRDDDGRETAGAGEVDPIGRSIEVNLNIYDTDGQVVDGTTSVLTVAQISDIVDHASQLIILRREGLTAALEAIMDELDEALTAASVIEVPRGYLASAIRQSGD